jgi:hypothetical protein
MNTYRIAVLVFAVGASLANFLAFKAQTEMWRPLAKPTPVVVSENPHLGTPAPARTGGTPQSSSDAAFIARLEAEPTPKPTIDPEAQVAYETALRDRDRVYDIAAAREVAILTVAGVAWFLVRPKNVA